MTVIRSLPEAIEVATKAAAQDEETEGGGVAQQDAPARLTDYTDRLHRGEVAWEGDPQDIGGYLGLADLLHEMGLRKTPADLTQLTLQNMELAETEGLVYKDPGLWNHLGTLLARQGDIEGARASLICALNRAHLAKSQEAPSILANLSAVSLQRGDLRAAVTWADRAAYLLRHDWELDPEARLTLDLVRLDLARAHDDELALRTALESLTESSSTYAQRSDADHSLALSASVALASARHEANPGGPELADLELLLVSAQVTLSPDHRETIIAQAALAAAEFEAAGGWDGQTNERTEVSVQNFAAAAARAVTSPGLGQVHPETHFLQAKLADMRASIASNDEPAHRIENMYSMREDTERVDAKRKALAEENDTIRLVTHTGAAYFIDETQLFYDHVRDALERGVRFNVIVSSPWSSLATFMPHDSGTDPDKYQNIAEPIESSPPYNNSFLPVIKSYKLLKSIYPRLIELRITCMDVSHSILLTSTVGFSEPYITSYSQCENRWGMNSFEVEFRRNSRYYAPILEELRVLWEISSTCAEFEANQGQHKATLRSEMSALPSVRMGASVRRGEPPRP